MKKAFYYVAIAICGIAIILLLYSMIFPSKTLASNKELIVGSWYCDAFDGKGGKYVNFTSDGTVTLYEEVTAADGTVVSQDSTSYGTMTYEVLRGNRLHLKVTVLGTAVTEQTIKFKLKGNDTLILDEDTYTRQ